MTPGPSSFFFVANAVSTASHTNHFSYWFLITNLNTVRLRRIWWIRRLLWPRRILVKKLVKAVDDGKEVKV